MRILRSPLGPILAAMCVLMSPIVLSTTASAQPVSYETRPEGLQQVEVLTAKAMRLFKSGDTDSALAAFQSAEKKARLHLGTKDRRYVKSLSNLALIYELTGSLTRSEEIYRKAILLTKANLAAIDPQLASLQNNLAAVVLQQCRVTDAHKLYRHALNLSVKSLGSNHRDTAMIRDNVEQLDRYLGAPQASRSDVVNAALGSGSSNISSLLQRCLS